MTTCPGTIGDDTSVTIEFDYTPEEAPVLHPVDDAYPGCAADAEISGVFIGTDNIMDALSEECILILTGTALTFMDGTNE